VLEATLAVTFEVLLLPFCARAGAAGAAAGSSYLYGIYGVSPFWAFSSGTGVGFGHGFGSMKSVVFALT